MLSSTRSPILPGDIGELRKLYDEFFEFYLSRAKREGSEESGGLNGERLLDELASFAERYRATTAVVLHYQGVGYLRLAILASLTEQYARAVGLDVDQIAYKPYFSGCGSFATPLEAAEHYFRWALSIDPSWMPSRFNLGLILYRRGDFAEARQELERALAANNKLTAKVHWVLALIAETQGDDPRTNHHYRAMFLVEQNHYGPVHRRAADFFRRTGQLAEALHHYDRALSFNYPPAPELMFIDPSEATSERGKGDMLRDLLRSKELYPQ